MNKKQKQPLEKNEKIFVSIASYRDSECPHTINDLFKKAEHPSRVVVGLCCQCDGVKEDHDRQGRTSHCFDAHSLDFPKSRIPEVERSNLWILYTC